MATMKVEQKEETISFQVPLPRTLHKKFKLKCMAMDTTMTKQTERLIEDFVKGGFRERS
jgi:hypothetical protein